MIPAQFINSAFAGEVSSALSGYSTRTLSDAGNLTADVFSYSTRALSLGAVNPKLEKLQELVTAAGSVVGTLFGFGDIQMLAVGAIIIIFTVGLIAFAFYMMALKPARSGKTKKQKRGKDSGMLPPPAHLTPTTRLAFPVVLVFVSLSSAAASALITGKILSLTTQTGASQSVLGTETEEKPNMVFEEEPLATGGVDIVRVVVPPGSRVNLRSQPDTAASVLAKIEDTREVVRLDESGDWTKVTLEDLRLEGWISTEFIEEGKPTEEGNPTEEGSLDRESVLGIEVGRSVVILDTPTGWVRVRETPSGTETGRVYPGDKLAYLDEIREWVQVELQDGSKGWVFKKYTKVEGGDY